MSKIMKRRQMFIGVEIAIGILFFLSILLGFLKFHPILMFFTFFFLFLWIILSLLWYYHNIKMPYKRQVVGPTIEGIKKGIQYSYEVTSRENYREIIIRHDLLPLAKKYDMNDEIKDEIDGINYTSFDLIASHQVSSGKSSRTVIDFQGKVYDVELGPTYCDYILIEDGKKIKPEGFQKIDLESIEMNDKFDLYTRDTIEIYKIFTPKLIQDCKAIQFFENKQSILCHLGSHFYIFLANKENQFESLAEKDQIEKEFYEQRDNLSKYLKVFLK